MDDPGSKPLPLWPLAKEVVEVADRERSDGSFVGRVAELQLVESCVADAAAGRPRVVWVEGEAGSGKTAFVRRILETLPAGCQVNGPKPTSSPQTYPSRW
jgi:MoxR-like ATPase